MTLREYTESYHDNMTIKKLFYTMSKTMEYVHTNGYYIASFQPEEINIIEDEKSRQYCQYQKVASFEESLLIKQMNKNMYDFALLQLATYADMLDYLTPRFMEKNPTFIKENFDRFKGFIPEDDEGFFKSVLVRQSYFYYSSFKDQQQKKEIEKMGQSLPSSTVTAPARGRSLVKETAASKLYSGEEYKQEMPIENKTAAFVTNYILPMIIFTLSLLIPLLAIVFSK